MMGKRIYSKIDIDKISFWERIVDVGFVDVTSDYPIPDNLNDYFMSIRVEKNSTIDNGFDVAFDHYMNSIYRIVKSGVFSIDEMKRIRIVITQYPKETIHMARHVGDEKASIIRLVHAPNKYQLKHQAEYDFLTAHEFHHARQWFDDEIEFFSCDGVDYSLYKGKSIPDTFNKALKEAAKIAGRKPADGIERQVIYASTPLEADANSFAYHMVSTYENVDECFNNVPLIKVTYNVGKEHYLKSKGNYNETTNQ